MEPLNECPSDGLLTQFLSGHLEPDAADAMATHVEGCSDCQSILEKLDSDDASIDQLIREQVAAPQLESQGHQSVGRIAGADAARSGDGRFSDRNSAALGPSGAANDKRIGDYLLSESLGQGGMGTVFRRPASIHRGGGRRQDTATETLGRSNRNRAV